MILKDRYSVEKTRIGLDEKSRFFREGNRGTLAGSVGGVFNHINNV